MRHKISIFEIDWEVQNIADTYWGAEVYQRNAIGKFSEEIAFGQGWDPLETLVVISDADEIISRDYLQYLKMGCLSFDNAALAVAMQRWSYYGFVWKAPQLWHGSSVLLLSTLSNDFHSMANDVRLARKTSNVVTLGDVARPAGWHCTFCLPLDQWNEKLSSFSHREIGTKRLHILSMARKTGKWLVDARARAIFDNSSSALPLELSTPSLFPSLYSELSYLLRIDDD